MKTYLKALWPVFLADLLFYVVLELWYARTAGSSLAWAVVGYPMAVIAGYLMAKSSGRVMLGVIGAAVLWFAWRPLLFSANVLLSVMGGTLSIDGISMLLVGVIGALVISSPIALALGALGGLISKKIRKIRGQTTNGA